MTSTAKRIILDFFILISLVAFPWWITAVLLLGGIIFFNRFFEAVLAGFVMDSLYGVPTRQFHGFTFVMTLGAALTLIVALYIKPKLR